MNPAGGGCTDADQREQVADGRLPVALLAHVAGALECGLHRQSWRTLVQRHALAAVPDLVRIQPLAKIKQQIIDAADERGIGTTQRRTRHQLRQLSAEAAVLLLANLGHWLPQLQSAGLITLAGDVDGGGLWAQIAWPDLDPALRTGAISGTVANCECYAPLPASPTGSTSTSVTLPRTSTAARSPWCWPRSPTPAAATETATSPTMPTASPGRKAAAPVDRLAHPELAMG